MRVVPSILAVAGLGLLVVVPGAAPAYGPRSNLCGTNLGICEVPWMPLGEVCYCGKDPGRVTLPPANWNDACATSVGVCRAQIAPVGSPCFCAGGRDRGQIIRR
jgi:hypothetical protein